MAEKNELTFSDKLMDKLITVENALPKDFNKERFVQNCLAILNDNEALRKVNPASVLSAVMKGSYLGFDPLKDFYVIPYGDKAQFQTSYKGELKFVKRYSTRPIKDIYSKLIRDGDTFAEKIVDGKPSIDFTPKTLNKGEILGVFAVVLYEDGGMEYEVMTTDEVNDVRKKYSRQANGNAWQKSWGEMARKTCLRRLVKHLDTDFETIEAKKAWEEGSDFDENKASKPLVTDIVSDPFAERVEVIEEDGTVTSEVVD